MIILGKSDNKPKGKKYKIPLEKDVQKKIIKKLKDNRWLVIKNIVTNLNGIPDIVAIRGGRYIWIEVKRPGSTVSELQKHRIGQLKDKGARVYVLDNENSIDYL